MSRNFNVGGQALIEGVMMRGPLGVGVAVRREDGSVRKEKIEIPAPKAKFFKLPIIRGVVALVSSMRIGIKALNISAKEFGAGEEGKFEIWLKKKTPKYAETIMTAITILFSLIVTVLFFSVLPTVITSFLKNVIKNPILLSLIEGLIKMALFIAYISVIRMQKDVKRVFMYHGAEHKAVFNYESGETLEVKNAREFGRLHPRCGTSYVFFVLAISILVFSFISWTSPIVRISLKIVFLPVVAGLGYELLKFTANDKPLVKLLRKPGLMIQRITTAEPDDSQLEIALEALKLVVPEDDY